jgi:4-amino-4-deoxy-L-arabinose transferase-like glycosyltransferase
VDGRSRKVVVVLVAVGIAVRLRPYAACPSYWYDEAYLLLNVFTKSFLDLFGPLREDQAAPPLFLWLLRVLYRLGGGGEWLMRLPALTASVAGLLAMAPLARRLGGRRGGLWAIAFCALGHHAAAHAAEVKPYALDFLTCEMILLATIHCQTVVSNRRPWIVLTVLATLAPWLSYPSVFVVGAASASLLLHTVRHRRHLAGWAIVTGLFALSSFVLWHVVIRHQATSSLRRFWAASFVDLSSPRAAAGWIGRCLVEIGNYGTREMGLPLLVLAIVGVASLRRRPARLVLLTGPLLLALLASAMRLYPLGGRLLFFLVPCLWLLAGRGLDALTRRLSPRITWLGWIAPLALLAPALLWAGRFLVAVTPRCQFREAFAYVEARRAPGDVLWVSHPQVYQVYHGRPPDLSAYSPPQAVERAARTGRLWMVCAVAGSCERYTAAETVARVQAAPCAALERRRFRGLHVMLYAPSTDVSGQWAWRRTAKTSD